MRSIGVANVLIIDDDSDLCEVVTEFLVSDGHQVTHATKLDDIYDQLSHSNPEVVLLDVRMPEINGLELLPQVKAYLPSARVIIVTAVDDYRIEDLFFEFGADGYLHKPFRGQAIQAAVRKALDQEAA